jgi:hypothetical protein
MPKSTASVLKSRASVASSRVKEPVITINTAPNRAAVGRSSLRGLFSPVFETFRLSEDTPLIITELECAEEGCPPLETVIVILDTPGDPRQYKVFKPLAEVTAEDIASVAAGAAEDNHDH